jgi:proprotein convertase subtilisin/kexin type 5
MPYALCLMPCICSPVCGDARRVGKEECDDGNVLHNDGCTSFCRVENG